MSVMHRSPFFKCAGLRSSDAVRLYWATKRVINKTDWVALAFWQVELSKYCFSPSEKHRKTYWLPYIYTLYMSIFRLHNLFRLIFSSHIQVQHTERRDHLSSGNVATGDYDNEYIDEVSANIRSLFIRWYIIILHGRWSRYVTGTWANLLDMYRRQRINIMHKLYKGKYSYLFTLSYSYSVSLR